MVFLSRRAARSAPRRRRAPYILADGRHGLGHKRRQGGRAVSSALAAAQSTRVGHRGASARRTLCDQLRRAGAGSAVRPARRPQLQQVGVRAVAPVSRTASRWRRSAASAPGGQGQQEYRRFGPGGQHRPAGTPAGKHPHPQAVSGQSQPALCRQFRRFGSGAVNFPGQISISTPLYQ